MANRFVDIFIIFTLIDDVKVKFMIFHFSLSLFSRWIFFIATTSRKSLQPFPALVFHSCNCIASRAFSMTDMSSVANPRDYYSSYESWLHHLLIFIITYFSILTWFYFRSRLRSGFLRFFFFYFQHREKVERYFSWFHNSFNLNIYFIFFSSDD